MVRKKIKSIERRTGSVVGAVCVTLKNKRDRRLLDRQRSFCFNSIGFITFKHYLTARGSRDGTTRAN